MRRLWNEKIEVMANYTFYVQYLCQRTTYLMTYVTVMAYFLVMVKIVPYMYKLIKKTNVACPRSLDVEKKRQFLKHFYRLVSWLTNQLYGKQMSLTKDDNENYILTLDGRQHKIENESRQLTLFRILGWMFVSEISVISSLIVLVIMKFYYDVTISHTCWHGLHTGTDCFPASIIDKPSIAWDESNFTYADICTEFEDVPPVNCIEWDNNNPVICFKKNYFPLTVVLALLTALIKLILPILMGIIGVIMNIIGSIINKCCNGLVKSDTHNVPTAETSFMTTRTCTIFRVMTTFTLFVFFPLIATFMVSTNEIYHWIRNLESEGYGYIEELIVGIAVFIPELIIFPWMHGFEANKDR